MEQGLIAIDLKVISWQYSTYLDDLHWHVSMDAEEHHHHWHHFFPFFLFKITVNSRIPHTDELTHKVAVWV